MNQKDIDWFKGVLDDVCDMLADIDHKKEDLENAADPDGRGGLDFGYAGLRFDDGYKKLRWALDTARHMKPVTMEDLDK